MDVRTLRQRLFLFQLSILNCRTAFRMRTSCVSIPLPQSNIETNFWNKKNTLRVVKGAHSARGTKHRPLGRASLWRMRNLYLRAIPAYPGEHAPARRSREPQATVHRTDRKGVQSHGGPAGEAPRT